MLSTGRSWGSLRRIIFSRASSCLRAAWRRGIAAHGNVHGDLRNANIIVRGARGLAPQSDVRLIDFDWAGRAGEVCYPLTRNAELDWAPGSAP